MGVILRAIYTYTVNIIQLLMSSGSTQNVSVPSNPLIMRVPFFLMLSFKKETQNIKGKSVLLGNIARRQPVFCGYGARALILRRAA